jgi:hypothetical protein
MLKKIRDTTPFIIFVLCLVFTILSYDKETYEIIKLYLGDLVGFSIITNVFMLSVYMNKRYCTATKITVLSLIVLNVLNLIYTYFGTDGRVYDICIMILTLIIIAFYKIEK